MQSRREFLVTTTKAGIVTAAFSLAGCGGGSKSDFRGETVRTNFDGSLTGVTTDPTPGSVFIGRSSSFLLSWPFGDPPREFQVALRRFLEPIGGESFDTPRQDISVQSVSDRTWRVSRRDNFDLDRDAVYYLELSASGGQDQRFVFITGGSRSVDIRPGTGGVLSDVEILPAPGSYGIARGIGGSGFDLEWSNTFPPPSNFQVQLRRYKEPRGDDNGGDSEQSIESEDIGSNRFRIRRRDRFDLDGRAAYYIELRDLDTGAVQRSAYTTE